MRRPTFTRRTLLVDLGRTTVAAAVAVPLLSACAGEDEPGPGDGATSGDAGGSSEGVGSVGTAEGVLDWQRASFGFVSAYVLVRNGEALVFDTGTGDDGVDPIATALEAAGVGWGAVGHVLVSHRHGDHAGGVEAVLGEAPDATLYAAMPDLDRIATEGATTAALVDGDQVLGLRIVATPGHTLGHVSALDETSGLLLAGDAMVRDREIGGTTGEGIEASPPDFTEDAELALESVRILADLDFETVLFGHGDPLEEDAKAQVEAYAATL